MKKFKNKIIKLLGGYTKSEYVEATVSGKDLLKGKDILKNMLNELETTMSDEKVQEMTITNVDFGYVSNATEVRELANEALTFEQFVDKYIRESRGYRTSYSESKDLYEAYLKMFEGNMSKGSYKLHKEAAIRNIEYRAGLTKDITS